MVSSEQPATHVKRPRKPSPAVSLALLLCHNLRTPLMRHASRSPRLPNLRRVRSHPVGSPSSTTTLASPCPLKAMQVQAGGKGRSPRAAVNKKFLLNTVHGLKSHNKREEEEDCWRQHNLDQKAREGRRSRSHDAGFRARSESSTDSVHRAASPVLEADTRQFWAEQKRKAVTAAQATASSSAPLERGRPGAKHGDGCKSRGGEHSDGSADEASLSEGDRKKKRRKEKEKEKKAKRKKKRKRERRRSSSSDGSSSSESDVDEGPRDGGKGSDKRRHRRKRKKSKTRSSRKKSKA